jgi:hypothetical protein
MPPADVTPADVAVVIPAFNRRCSVGRAIASVAGPEGGPGSLVVVDDGSTDGTAAAARSAIAEAGILRARVIRQSNAGPGAARNAGAAAVDTDYVAFLDSDDHWYPWTLAAVADALGSAGRPALLFLQTVEVAPGGRPEVVAPAPPRILAFDGFLEAAAAVRTIRFGAGNVVVRRDVLMALGGFTGETRCAEDTDLFLRAARAGRCALLRGGPFVAVEEGRADNLTGSFGRVRDGAAFVMARAAAGAYPEAPGGRPFRSRLLAKVAANAIILAFASGRPLVAYRLLATHAALLARGREWRWLVRLPFFPLLALVRPASYRPHRTGG